MEQPIYNKKTGQHEVNGIRFDGHFTAWKLEYSPHTYLKESELSGDEWRKGGSVRIYLNDDCVLEEFCREPERALMLLSRGLHELQCFFEGFGIPDLQSWKTQIVGKKVRHGSIPSTIERYCGNGEVIVRRDDGKSFRPDLYPGLMSGEYGSDEWKDRDRVHITDKRLNWSVV